MARKSQVNPGREAVRAVRSRFFQALALGLGQDEAEAVANGSGAQPFFESPSSGQRGVPGDGVIDPHKFAGVTIPGDYESLGWPKLSHLANEVSDEPIKNKATALAAIAAEIARREAYARDVLDQGNVLGQAGGDGDTAQE